jgi:PAS domain S-box-containing protein
MTADDDRLLPPAEQQAEATLREQANLLDLTHDAILVRDMKGTVRYWNRGAQELYGWSAEQAVGKVAQELLKTIFPVPREQIEAEVVGMGRWEGELVQTRKDGSEIVVASRWSLQRDESSAPVAILVTNNDITERKRTELERRRLASLVEQAADLMAISDLSGGTPIYLNKAGLKMVGFESWQEARTRRGIHYMFPEDRPFVNEVLWPAVLEKGSWSGEMRFRHFKTGEPIPVLYSAFRIDDPQTGQPVNVGNVCRDITERKRAEAKAREDDRRYREMQTELAHANRVATMGQLTASIAHEVNQPIAATVTHAHAALRWLGARPPNLEEVRQALIGIVKDGNRAGDVIHRIRALINKAPPRKDRLEINGAILEIIELTRGEAGKCGISVVTQLADELPVVEGDRVQLQQVLLNLIVNAFEAMGATGEGSRELLIGTEKGEPGGVVVAVQDSGPGLDAAMLERVFESFYTTKPTGLGLGLSICRSIIEAHGGRLWASANQRHGATFHFTLPADANISS